MSSPIQNSLPKFGTMAVFLTSICTILGAILFLRFGYAVANTGLLGTLGIIAIGHLVTIPTALAVAEIATNRRVAGGGAYYIISRSFGINIGATIGVALFFSQAISVAFYIIAFAESFQPVIDWVYDSYNIQLTKRMISLPAMAFITILMSLKGADIGVKALYFVAFVLLVSLLMFFAGGTTYVPPSNVLVDKVREADDFFKVFAICFPAFTGMAAGLGLSGDLKDPKRAIPMGTLLATFVGMAIYAAVGIKLAYSGSPEAMNADMLFMSRVAIWGPIIPIGLAAASISSALGSIMVAPRTLQALGLDSIFNNPSVNDWMSKGRSRDAEPFNAGMITALIGFVFVAIGDIDFVAQIITMFFMLTYGAICLISFLEHFAADPAYRPAFRSRWYFSLTGFIFSLWLMFRMNTGYAVASIVLMIIIYYSVTWKRKEKQGMAVIFQGVSFQLSRSLQVFLQKARREETEENWRPSIVCVSRHSFDRVGAFHMLKWLSHRHGFGTYMHLIDGYLSRKTHEEAAGALKKLLEMADISNSNVYLNTLISPSFTSAVAQVIQLPGVSGKDNNMVMFEYSGHEPESTAEIVDNFNLMKSVDFDVCLLRVTEKGFGFRHEIHLWISPEDYENSHLMILLAYILLGHPDWKHGIIKIMALYPAEELEEQRLKLETLVRTGRLPIAPGNIQSLVLEENKRQREVINEVSKDADLTLVGIRDDKLRHQGPKLFEGYADLGNMLFISASEEKEIS